MYLEPLLYACLQEAVDLRTVTASEYMRNLVFQDLKARSIMTPEILEALVTGQPLKVTATST